MTHNSKVNEDLRIRRTKKLLQEAMIALTVEKGFSNISVRDITERAMVNRSTFYRHYLDKYDLLDQYLNEVAEFTSEAAFLAEKEMMGEAVVPSGLIWLLRHIQSCADFYRVMLGPDGDTRFIQRFRQMSETRYRSLLMKATPTENKPPVEMGLSYMSCAGIGAISWWLENNQPFPVEKLAVWLGQMSMNSAIFLAPDLELLRRS